MILIARMFGNFEMDEMYLCVVEIDQDYARHLLGLMDRAKALQKETSDLLSLQLSDCSPDFYIWSGQLDDEIEEQGQDIWEGDAFVILEKMPKSLEEQDPERFGYACLTVSGENIRWEANPKHTDWLLESADINHEIFEDFVQEQAA